MAFRVRADRWDFFRPGLPSMATPVTGAFEALDLSSPWPRYGWVVLTSDDARKIFGEELKATQQHIVADLGHLSLISESRGA